MLDVERLRAVFEAADRPDRLELAETIGELPPSESGELAGVDAFLAVARNTDPPARATVLATLQHVAGTEPGEIRPSLPLFVEVAAVDDWATSRVAAGLVVAIVL